MPNESPPQLKLSDISMKLMRAYRFWHEISPRIPKMRRYSLGIRIDALFAELFESITTAQFSLRPERPPIITKAIGKNDVLKAMLYILFELDGIKETSFAVLAPLLDEVGRMLYGWRNKIASEQKPPRT